MHSKVPGLLSTRINLVDARPCCDRKSRTAYAQSFPLWQEATIEFTCHDYSPRMLVVTFNRSHARIIRDYTPRSLYYCLFVPHICMVLFFTHTPFVVNRTINATPPERLQQPQQGRRTGGAWRGHFPLPFGKGWQRVHLCPYITVS